MPLNYNTSQNASLTGEKRHPLDPNIIFILHHNIFTKIINIYKLFFFKNMLWHGCKTYETLFCLQLVHSNSASSAYKYQRYLRRTLLLQNQIRFHCFLYIRFISDNNVCRSNNKYFRHPYHHSLEILWESITHLSQST